MPCAATGHRPCVVGGQINRECFRTYVARQLGPILRPNDIVTMDNLGSRRSAAVRQIIRAAGARLWFQPPYPPDLNPIEQVFAKIKRWMRKFQNRTIECQNYFANAGNASVKTLSIAVVAPT